MTQLNLNMNPEFEKKLLRFMRIRGFKTKAEAIRAAIREGLEHVTGNERRESFSEWIGLGLAAPMNTEPRFASDDDLWGG